MRNKQQKAREPSEAFAFNLNENCVRHMQRKGQGAKTSVTINFGYVFNEEQATEGSGAMVLTQTPPPHVPTAFLSSRTKSLLTGR